MRDWELDIGFHWPHQSFTWFVSYDYMEPDEEYPSHTFILRVLFCTLTLNWDKKNENS